MAVIFVELWDHCKKYGDRIYVRVEREGRWMTLTFNELTIKEQHAKIRDWWMRDVLPHRVVKE